MNLGPIRPWPRLRERPTDPVVLEELWIMEGGDQTLAEYSADPQRWLPDPPRGGTGVSPRKPVLPPNVSVRG